MTSKRYEHSQIYVVVVLISSAILSIFPSISSRSNADTARPVMVPATGRMRRGVSTSGKFFSVSQMLMSLLVVSIPRLIYFCFRLSSVRESSSICGCTFPIFVSTCWMLVFILIMAVLALDAGAGFSGLPILVSGNG